MRKTHFIGLYIVYLWKMSDKSLGLLVTRPYLKVNSVASTFYTVKYNYKKDKNMVLSC